MIAIVVLVLSETANRLANVILLSHLQMPWLDGMMMTLRDCS
jgi:hypothetical protein